jgi:hypothetical protein
MGRNFMVITTIKKNGQEVMDPTNQNQGTISKCWL